MNYTLKELQTLLEKINPKVDWNRILMGYPEILTEEQLVHYLVNNLPPIKEIPMGKFTADELAILRLVMKSLL